MSSNDRSLAYFLVAIIAGLVLGLFVSACAPDDYPVADKPALADAGYSVVDLDSSAWEVTGRSCGNLARDVVGQPVPIATCAYADASGSYAVVDAVLLLDGRGPVAFCVATCAGLGGQVLPWWRGGGQ